MIAAVDASAVCPLCGSGEHDLIFDLRDVANPLAVPGTVARCRGCPLWFKIVDDPARLASAYGDGYADTEGADDYMTGSAARAFFRRALSRLGDAPAAAAAAPTLLDIGAGQGTLIEEATRLGYDACGIDRCERLVRGARARGLRVECAAVENLSGDARFDVVTMMDVVEHLEAPRRALAAVHRLLKPGGRLLVYTPNHRGAVVSVARALHTIGAQLPVREIFGGNHLCFFDDRSLPLLLRSEGFAVDALERSAYDPRRPGGPVSAASLAAVTAVEWLGRPFGRVFRMLAYATKVVR